MKIYNDTTDDKVLLVIAAIKQVGFNFAMLTAAWGRPLPCEAWELGNFQGSFYRHRLSERSKGSLYVFRLPQSCSIRLTAPLSSKTNRQVDTSPGL